MKKTEKMPNWAFRMMEFMFKLSDFFRPKHNYVEEFGIKKGMTVVDYGCGPGRYIYKISDKVTPSGLVYAVDVHELAIRAVEKLLAKYQLTNVKTFLADGYTTSIPDRSSDIVIALDMFHMVEDTQSFLGELHRITKPTGILIIENGHQPREKARKKLVDSNLWKVAEENVHFMKCKPVQAG
jgi:ubiquinone/menaquinone biosynthesis C-methylase UbiE